MRGIEKKGLMNIEGDRVNPLTGTPLFKARKGQSITVG